MCSFPYARGEMSVIDYRYVRGFLTGERFLRMAYPSLARHSKSA